MTKRIRLYFPVSLGRIGLWLGVADFRRPALLLSGERYVRLFDPPNHSITFDQDLSFAIIAAPPALVSSFAD